MSETIKDTPTVADPAAVEPTTLASEATSDPIRPTGTDALTAESRPEVTGEAAAATTGTESAPTSTSHKIDKHTAVVEASPMYEGVLGYKAPGLIKSLRFSKKHFWFSDEPLTENALSTYLKSEKPEHAHHNAAHATQTGKGLLFFAKRSEDKSHPAGILNLAEVTDLVKEDFALNDFSFKLHGHKHAFQANDKTERDGWIVAVNQKIEEAKAGKEGITSSEGYKSSFKKFGAPAAGVGAVGAASKATRSHSRPRVDEAAETPVGTSETAPTTGHTATATAAPEALAAPKHSEKSRSQSRKRTSIFGKVLGKKDEAEEKREIKKEEKAEQKEEKKEEKAIAKEIKHEEKEEKKIEKEEAKHHDHSSTATTHEPVTAGAVAPIAGGTAFDAKAIAELATGTPEATTTTETSAPVTTATTAPTSASPEVTTPTATKAKRGSVFGSFFGKKDLPTRDTPPAVPAKDEPVSETAPQLAAPTTTEPTTSTVTPAETSNASPEAALAGTAPTSTTTTSGPTTATTPKTEKGGFFGFLKQKEAQMSEKKEEKKEEKREAAEPTSTTAATTTTTPPTTTAPVTESATESAIAAPETTTADTTATTAPSTTAPVITEPSTTTTASATKPQRRSSFFDSLSGKKEKKTDAISGDEGTDGEGKKSKGLTGLFRKASRGAPKEKSGPVTDSTVPPPISKDVPATETAAPTTESAPTTTSEALPNGTSESLEKPVETTPATSTAPVTASA